MVVNIRRVSPPCETRFFFGFMGLEGGLEGRGLLFLWILWYNRIHVRVLGSFEVPAKVGRRSKGKD